jgi:hypothetical protein
MSDYQAVYDAVRSRIHGCDVGSIIGDAVRSGFDASWAIQLIQQEFTTAGYEMQRPSVLYRPKMFVDGDQWCALYGDNLQDGVAGFGDSPDNAMRNFDENWMKKSW